MSDVTTYTSCLRIQRTDGFVICITDLDKDLEINDALLGIGSDDQTYLSPAGYTPTNIQTTSDNAVNNGDIEGVLTSFGVQREDIIGGRYDFAKLHVFLYDYTAKSVYKLLGSGHWGEATIKDGSYVAEFRSLSQQMQQTIGRTYNPECDEQLGGTRCGVTLGLFPKQNGKVTAQTSTTVFTDTNKIDADGFYNGMVLTWTSGENDTISSVIDEFVSGGQFTLLTEMPFVIGYGDTYTIDSATYSGLVNVYGGSKTIIRDSSLGVNDYSNMYVEFTSGENNGDFALISSSSTGQIALTSPLPNNILEGDEYDVINMTGERYMALGEILTVTDSQNFTASLVSDSALSDGYFNYGKLKFVNGQNDNLFMEVKNYTQATGTFELFLPMAFQVEVGDQFQVFAGCDRRLTTCKNKFQNHINFQGFPYIPGQDQISKFGGQ